MQRELPLLSPGPPPSPPPPTCSLSTVCFFFAPRESSVWAWHLSAQRNGGRRGSRDRSRGRVHPLLPPDRRQPRPTRDGAGATATRPPPAPPPARGWLGRSSTVSAVSLRAPPGRAHSSATTYWRGRRWRASRLSERPSRVWRISWGHSPHYRTTLPLEPRWTPPCRDQTGQVGNRHPPPPPSLRTSSVRNRPGGSRKGFSRGRRCPSYQRRWSRAPLDARAAAARARPACSGVLWGHWGDGAAARLIRGRAPRHAAAPWLPRAHPPPVGRRRRLPIPLGVPLRTAATAYKGRAPSPPGSLWGLAGIGQPPSAPPPPPPPRHPPPRTPRHGGRPALTRACRRTVAALAPRTGCTSWPRLTRWK